MRKLDAKKYDTAAYRTLVVGLLFYLVHLETASTIYFVFASVMGVFALVYAVIWVIVAIAVYEWGKRHID